MLRMAGVQGHPAVRILIGVVLIALGIARHTAAGMVIGVVLVLWGFAAVLRFTATDRDVDSHHPRSR
jgi:uncharacterized membrane protein YidH (DUF202 family)